MPKKSKAYPLKVYLEGKFTTCVRSNRVAVTAAEMAELQKYKACPYKGTTPQDFLAYLPKLMDAVSTDYDGCPSIARELWDTLYSEDELVEFNQVWSERDEPVTTQLKLDDAEGNTLAETEGRHTYI
jgi:hypothetical protein